MSLQAYPFRTNIPDNVCIAVRGLGANGTALDIEDGAAGITSARSGEGAYSFTFNESPGTFVAAHFSFGAATPGDMKGYTAVVDTAVSATVFTFVVYDSTFTAADVIANQYLYVTMYFRTSGVGGGS